MHPFLFADIEDLVVKNPILSSEEPRKVAGTLPGTGSRDYGPNGLSST
jgi:hypothetical protein